MTYLKRLICNLLRDSRCPAPRITEEDFDAFITSTPWIVFRQEAAVMLNMMSDIVEKPGVPNDQLHEAIGSIRVLKWVLDDREELRKRIAKTINTEDFDREQRLLAIMKEMEEEDHARSSAHNAND